MNVRHSRLAVLGAPLHEWSSVSFARRSVALALLDGFARAALLAVLALSGVAARGQPLRAGAASAGIETPVGAPLGGYGSLSGRHSTGTLDLPEARALVLEDTDLRVAFVTLDLVIVRPALRGALIAKAAALGIPHVVVIATHTHSGPGGHLEGALPSRLAGGGTDETAKSRILRAAEDALERAAAALQPTQIGVGLGDCDLARNRRREDGPREHALPVIRLTKPDGTPLALLFAYGVHGVTLGPNHRSASADLIGVARRALDPRFGTTLFVPGPSGDQNPFSGGHAAWPESLEAQIANRDAAGARLAQSVAAAAETAAPEPQARVALARLEAPLPPLDLADHTLLWWFRPLVQGVLDGFFSRTATFHAIDLGTARILTVPAEPSSALGDELRQLAGPTHTPIVVTHADDWFGYALEPDDYDTGGYESAMSFFGRDFAAWLLEQSRSAAQRLDGERSAPGEVPQQEPVQNSVD